MNLIIPQWVREACRKWGRQKRRVWYGGERYEGGGWHVDGWAQSFLGRVQDERVAAGSGSIADRQQWPEVYRGEGLEVQRAVIGMPELPVLVIHLHYVFDPEFGLSVKVKAANLSMPVRDYWRTLNDGEAWVWARLTHENVRTLGNPEILVFPAIAKRPKKRYKSANSDSMGVVSLTALRRPTLSLK